MTPGIREILERLGSGDGDAGPALARALLPAVRALALSGTLDPQAAEEVTAKSLARLVPRLGEVEGPSGLLPLAEEITRREINAWIREHGGRTTEIVGIPAETAAKARSGALRLEEVFGELPPDRAARMLLEAAGWIPDPYQTVFLLRYLEGLDYRAIADLAGIGEREVGTTLTAARRLYERELTFHLKKLANP